MSDKLDWLNEHFVLFKHPRVVDVVANENYKIPFEQQELANNNPQSEDFVKALSEAGLYKEACEFLSYNMHNRSLVWWGYCCVLSMEKEHLICPIEERDIADIGKPKPFEIPEWAKEIEEDGEISPETQAEIDKAINELKATAEEAKKRVPPEIMEMFEEAKKIVYDEIRAEIGMDPEEMLQAAVENFKKQKDFDIIDYENSPIFKAEKELKAKIEKMRQETVDTIKSAVPKKPKEQIKIESTNAMNATYSYIVAPNDINAKQCLDLGNLCPDVPEGLLSLVAFWSYGNMMPGTDNVIKTPPGLASNGFNSLLNMLALQQGGTRKYKERLEHYFEIGKQVGFGRNNWSLFLANKQAPHEVIAQDDSFVGLMNDESMTHVVAQQNDTQEQHSSPTPQFKRFSFDEN